LASTPLFAPTVFAALIGGGGSANTLVSNRTYRADGVLTNQTFGNGLNEIRQYDLQGRLVNQFVGNADTRVYGYDANGNLTNEQSLPQVGAYTYDAIDRLIRESQTNTTTDTNAYTYDPNGNRSSDLNNNGKTRPYTYTPGTNRLTRMGAQTSFIPSPRDPTRASASRRMRAALGRRRGSWGLPTSSRGRGPWAPPMVRPSGRP